MVKLEQDSNVKAEAANSLSFFEQIAVPHLVLAFHQNPNWLVRRSILAAMIEMNVEIGCSEALIEICVQALSDEDITVQEDGIEGLRSLAGGSQHAAALSQLLNLVNSDSWQVRRRTARALKQFSDPQARAALSQLSQDADHRVVAAVLEDLLPE
jgi:HEAT repeat protein